MKLQSLREQLNLRALVDGAGAREVTGGYSSDLLSDVLAHARHGDIWITNQKHINVVAVASLLGLSAVVIAGGVSPDENAVAKAREENVPLFVSDLPAYEVAGRVYALGVRADAGKV